MIRDTIEDNEGWNKFTYGQPGGILHILSVLYMCWKMYMWKHSCLCLLLLWWCKISLICTCFPHGQMAWAQCAFPREWGRCRSFHLYISRLGGSQGHTCICTAFADSCSVWRSPPWKSIEASLKATHWYSFFLLYLGVQILSSAVAC